MPGVGSWTLNPSHSDRLLNGHWINDEVLSLIKIYSFIIIIIINFSDNELYYGNSQCLAESGR